MDSKEKILQHASKRFLSIGIRNVTMDSLATELAISKRTIYELIGDKDTLVIESIRYMIIENNKELLKIIETTDNVIEAIFIIISRQEQMRRDFPVVFIEDIKKYFSAVQASFYSSKSNLKQFSITYPLLEKGIKQGVFRKDLKIELVDNFIHEIITMVHTSDRIRCLNPADIDVFYNIFLPYLRGICTEKGLNLMNKYFEERDILNHE
jgi:TetR/AcrR family transcriptional regulator, cholesterol catabolism regulator